MNLSNEETFGLTTAEALASGTPVIVYNKTASPELVSTGTGFVIDKNNYLGLVKAINEIKGNNKSRYSDNCRKQAIEKFNSISTYNSYFQLYNKMIDNKL